MIEDYDLNRDLDALKRALAGDMPEAAVFYCGRALEVTAARAVAALNLDPGAQIFANLDLLERLSCISRPALYLGHALRRLSNDARHILRPLSKKDAEFAALCIAPWLQWYLEDYFRGPRINVSDQTFGVPSALSTGNVGEVLALLRKSQTSGENVSRDLIALFDEEIARIPALSSMIAETLISCALASDAQNILDASLMYAKDDLRLCQLSALARRRMGHPDQTVALLKTLSVRYSEDEETLGITAGALKAQWEQNGVTETLDQAIRLYRKGWQVSHERNYYLGVNAATLELWKGIDSFRDHAVQIAQLFARRNEKLMASGVDLSNQRDYYDLVTEAEARLLSGDDAGARSLYTNTFTRFASRRGDIEGTKQQANRSLVLLGGKPIE